jgi:peroxiredoxin
MTEPFAKPFLSGPATGRMLLPFAPQTAAAVTVRLSDYKPRSNVVVLVHHGIRCADCTSFLRALGQGISCVGNCNTVVLAISSDAVETQSAFTHELGPFALLSDIAGQVAAQDCLQSPAPVIADRSGELWAAWPAGSRHAFPTLQEIPPAILEVQCREYEAPEWPVSGSASGN